MKDKQDDCCGSKCRACPNWQLTEQTVEWCRACSATTYRTSTGACIPCEGVRDDRP